MKTFITTSTNSATGYELRIAHDNGVVDVLPIDKKVPDKATNGEFDWYLLPENPTGRKMVSGRRIKDGMELGVKMAHNTTVAVGNKPAKKGIEEYLTEDELKVWNELKAKAELRAKIEKAKVLMEQKQAEYEKLLTEAQA